MEPSKGYGWGWTLLWFVGGMLGPLACLSIELAWRMCRESLFDPLPTAGHVLLVLIVPLATYLGLKALVQPEFRKRPVGLLLGSAVCTTLMYALPFVPLLPFALLLSLAGIGLLGLAPVLAPLATATLALRLHKLRLPGLATGFLGSVLLLALLDLGSVRTILKVREQWAHRDDGAGAQWLREQGDRGMLEELGGGRPSARPLAYLVRRSVPIDARFVREHWRQFTGEDLPGSLQWIGRD
jgi:hypothetical protein